MKPFSLGCASIAAAIFSLGVVTDAHALPLPDTSSCNSASGYCLNISNTSTSSASGAVHGTAAGIGVAGTSTAASGIGVYGYATGGGIGMFGVGGPFGIEAVASDSNGTGLIATGGGNSTGTGIGVTGMAPGSGAGVSGQSLNGNGVFGSATGSGGSGVYGQHSNPNGIGLAGRIPGTGSGLAIYGDAAFSSTAWAGSFDGRVRATSFTSTSDARLKDTVRDLSYGTTELQKLRPVSYKWKNQTGDRPTQLGLIAQEVQKVIPEVVDTDRSTGMLSVNYQAILPVAIRTLQQQQRLIDRQDARIAALEQQANPLRGSFVPSGSALLTGLALLALTFVIGRRSRNNA